MLRVCKPILGSEKAVVLDNGFCFAKGITELEVKGLYVGYLIKTRRYWPKTVHCELIDTQFEDKEVGGVGML